MNKHKKDISVKSFEFKFLKEDLNQDTNVENESGIIEGYASVFDVVDSGNDVIRKGAFLDTILTDFEDIKILSDHESYDLPIGKPIELKEDEKGLFIKAKISDTTKGKDVKILVKDKVINKMSIGYTVEDYEVLDNIRYIKKVKLYEVSPVTWAMNNQAKITNIKSNNKGDSVMEITKKDLENAEKKGFDSAKIKFDKENAKLQTENLNLKNANVSLKSQIEEKKVSDLNLAIAEKKEEFKSAGHIMDGEKKSVAVTNFEATYENADFQKIAKDLDYKGMLKTVVVESKKASVNLNSDELETEASDVYTDDKIDYM